MIIHEIENLISIVEKSEVDLYLEPVGIIDITKKAISNFLDSTPDTVE